MKKKQELKLERGAYYYCAARPNNFSYYFSGNFFELADFNKDTVTLCIRHGNGIEYPRWKMWRPLFEANATMIRNHKRKAINGGGGGPWHPKKLFGFNKSFK